MTAQREVIEAFLNGENAPATASNFHMEIAPDGYSAYLVGDKRLVFGERQPLSRFEIYTGHVPWGYEMPVTKSRSFYHVNRDALNSQRNRVNRRVQQHERNGDFPEGTDLTYSDTAPPPTVAMYDLDFGVFEGVEHESQ